MLPVVSGDHIKVIRSGLPRGAESRVRSGVPKMGMRGLLSPVGPQGNRFSDRLACQLGGEGLLQPVKVSHAEIL